MRRSLSFAASLVIFAVLCAAPAAVADDRAACQDEVGPPADAIAACGRLIASGQVKGAELAGTYVWRGSHLTFTAQHDRAIADYTQALQLDSKLAGAYRGRGASYEAKGDLARALADFSVALTIDSRLQDVAESLRRVEGKLAAIDKSTQKDEQSVVKTRGLDLANLSEELRRRHKIRDGIKGVVITAVEAGSAAETRLSAGDVIVEVDREPVASAADVQKHVDQLKKEGYRSVLLLVAKADGGRRYVALGLQ